MGFLKLKIILLILLIPISSSANHLGIGWWNASQLEKGPTSIWYASLTGPIKDLGYINFGISSVVDDPFERGPVHPTVSNYSLNFRSKYYLEYNHVSSHRVFPVGKTSTGTVQINNNYTGGASNLFGAYYKVFRIGYGHGWKDTNTIPMLFNSKNIVFNTETWEGIYTAINYKGTGVFYSFDKRYFIAILDLSINIVNNWNIGTSISYDSNDNYSYNIFNGTLTW